MIETLKPCVKWTDDCQGKKDYDGPLLRISTRYWPSGGGFHILQTGPSPIFEESKDPRIRPSAHSAIQLVHGAPDENGDGECIIISEKEFKADTEAEVKAMVEAWVTSEVNRISILLNQPLPFETERALRALTKELATKLLRTLSFHRYNWHEEDVRKFNDILDEKLLPLFNAAVEQATMQEHANHTQFASDMYSTLIDPCATGSMKESDIWAACLKAARDNRQALYDAQNMVAGAYAAAAKHYLRPKDSLTYVCGCGTEFSWRVIDGVRIPEAWQQHILALTPADARQARQQLERMACGHLKADEITICDDMGCIQNSHQREYNLDCRCGGRWVTKCGICAAIASAEARARLEAAQLCDEMGRNGKGLFEASEALYKLAAARTPDSDNPRCFCPDCNADLGHFYSNRIVMKRTPDSTKEPEK